MKLVMHRNNTVTIDGATYAMREPDRSRLKAKLAAYHRRDKNCWVSLNADHEAPIQQMGNVVLLLQQSGFLGSVGFLTEPHNDK